MAKTSIHDLDRKVLYVACSKPHKDPHCPCEDCKSSLSARHAVIESMRGLIYGSALRIYGRHKTAEPDELYQVAVCKILKVFDSYDPYRGVLATTYFGTVSDREMSEYANRDHVVVPPRRDRMKESANIKAASEKAKNIKSFEQMTATNSEVGCLEDIGIRARSNILDHREASPEIAANSEEAKELITKALKTLPPKLKDVVKRRMRGETLAVISVALKVSREWVRQLEQAGHDKMRAYILSGKWRD